NLVTNSGFENGTTDGWTPFQSTLSISSVAHSGAYACTVCLQTGAEFTIDDQPNTVSNPLQGDVYLAQAWVRDLPVAAGGQTVTIVLREWLSPGVNGTRSRASLVASSTWQLLQVQHTMSANAESLDVYIGNDTASAGDCFIVDDIAVYKLP